MTEFASPGGPDSVNKNSHETGSNHELYEDLLKKVKKLSSDGTKVVIGSLGFPIRVIETLSLEEAQALTDSGQKIPLSLAPNEYWWTQGQEHPRFGEEMLGTDF